MITVACSCRALCRNFHRSYMSLSNRSPRSSRTTKLLGLILVPVIPSVSAQSDNNDIPKRKKEEAIINVTAKPNAEEVVKNEIAATKTEEVIFNNIEESQSFDEKGGWEKVRTMFEKSDDGQLSKELSATIQSTQVACVIGLIYGGVIASRRAFVDFMERNQATIFENHLDAKRRLRNHMTVHFGKGALRWSIRLSVFTGGFMLFLTTMSAYRGRNSLIDYMASGAVVGGLLRLKLGPAAVAVGGGLGGVLGLLCGLSTQTILTLYGASFDDVISFQYEIDRRRNNLYKEVVTKGMEESVFNSEEIELLKGHEKT